MGTFDQTVICLTFLISGADAARRHRARARCWMLGWDIGLELIGISTQQRMRDNIFQSHITSAAVGVWVGDIVSETRWNCNP